MAQIGAPCLRLRVFTAGAFGQLGARCDWASAAATTTSARARAFRSLAVAARFCNCLSRVRARALALKTIVTKNARLLLYDLRERKLVRALRLLAAAEAQNFRFAVNAKIKLKKAQIVTLNFEARNTRAGRTKKSRAGRLS